MSEAGGISGEEISVELMAFFLIVADFALPSIEELKKIIL